MKLIIPENIQKIEPYKPGKTQAELEREYGISRSVKIASNESPYAPSARIVKAITDAVTGLNRYPDAACHDLVETIALKYGVQKESVVVGNGSNDLIDFLVKTFIEKGDEVITSHPSFLMYQKFVQVRGGINHIIPLKDMRHDLTSIVNNINDKTRLIFIDNPNNPTGTTISPRDLYVFLSTIPEHVIVVIDEAYADFMDEELRPDAASLINNTNKRCPVVFLRTFSKAYGLAGLRVGYGLMNYELAACLHKVRQPFTVNTFAQIGAKVALEDEEHYLSILQKNRDGIRYLYKELQKLGCTAYPTQGNFILVDIKGDADKLYKTLLRKGFIIRSMRAYGFPSCIRVTVGTEAENSSFINNLEKSLGELGYGNN